MNLQDSNLYLLKHVDLDSNHEYSVDFDNIELQNQYFDNMKTEVIESTGYSYIRKNESIRIEGNVDDLRDFNYLYYSNPDGKRYYCFITEKKYVSDSVTDIFIKLDVFQTFMFDITLGECFVEREHQDRFKLNESTKTIDPLYNTIEENIDYGHEYLTSSTKSYPYQLDDGAIILFAYIWRKPVTEDRETYITTINEIVQGYGVYVVPFLYKRSEYDKYDTFYQLHFKHKETEFDIVRNHIPLLTDPSTLQVVISPFSPQKWRLSVDDEQKKIILSTNNFEDKNSYLKYDTDKGEGSSLDNIIFISRFTSNKINSCFVKTYYDKLSNTPKYNHNYERMIERETKLNIYPYTFIKVNQNGSEYLIKNEYLNDITHFTYVTGYQSLSISASSSIKINKYLTDEESNKITNLNIITNQLPCFVDLATDVWEKYILENRAQRTAGYVNGVVSTVGGIALGGASGLLKGELASVVALSGAQTALSGAGGIIGQLTKEHDIRHQPHDTKQFSGDLNMTENISDFGIIFNEYNITPEYRLKIYNFFYHFGYKCCDFKIPNIRSRFYFNYIKNTSTTFIKNSGVDKDYVDELKEIFNKGITIWHSRQNNKTPFINDYEYENSEMNLEEAINV